MFIIFKKEVSTFFNSLIAYIVIGVFLLLTGLMFWLYPDTNILDYGYAEMDAFFQIAPFILLFFVPAVTMRMLSEEIKSGTIELLFTKPLSVWDIVFGKFLSCVFIIALALLPTLIYYASIYKLGNPVGNVDSAAVFGSYFGLLLLSSVYAAVGIFMSSLTKNQVVAFLLAAVCSYILFVGIEQFSALFSGSIQFFLSYLGLSFHYNSIGKGIVDSRDVIYFVSLSVFFLLLTLLSLNTIRK
jgi:ABC-2 type transport system permease protein